MYFPAELHRKAALEEDLKYFYGRNWREEIPCPEATRKYVERLHYIGKNEPELLVAHAYTRYLGDLSGGQVLKKIAQKALQLPSTGEGLAFFTFDGVSNATKFKQLYRSRMNALEMDLATKKRVMEEAKKAFLLNIQVSNSQPALPAHILSQTRKLLEGKYKASISAGELMRSCGSGRAGQSWMAMLLQPGSRIKQWSLKSSSPSLSV